MPIRSSTGQKGAERCRSFYLQQALLLQTGTLKRRLARPLAGNVPPDGSARGATL
jgi:hypothetical protein